MENGLLHKVEVEHFSAESVLHVDTHLDEFPHLVKAADVLVDHLRIVGTAGSAVDLGADLRLRDIDVPPDVYFADGRLRRAVRFARARSQGSAQDRRNDRERQPHASDSRRWFGLAPFHLAQVDSHSGHQGPFPAWIDKWARAAQARAAAPGCQPNRIAGESVACSPHAVRTVAIYVDEQSFVPVQKVLRRVGFSPPRRAKAHPTKKPRSCSWTGT